MPAKNNAIWKTSSLWKDTKLTLQKADSIIVFDLETTGLSRSQDRIIELAAIRYRISTDYSLQEECCIHQYINPGKPLPPEITEITKITDEMLADKPTEDAVFCEIEDFFDGDLVAGYNILTFDCKFMNEYYGRMGQVFSPPGAIDCIQLARNLLSKGTDVENFKLETVGAYFGLKFNAHSAIEDARTTGKLLEIFLKEYAQQEQAPTAPATGTIQAEIQQISFWPGFKGFSRIYILTNCGNVYFDIRSSSWGGKDVDISLLDMPKLEADAFRMVNAKTQAEFSQFRGTLTA